MLPIKINSVDFRLIFKNQFCKGILCIYSRANGLLIKRALLSLLHCFLSRASSSRAPLENFTHLFSMLLVLTMGFSGAAHGWGGAKSPPT